MSESAQASERAGLIEAPPAGLYHLDPLHTFAEFRVRHAVVGMVDGRFGTIEGDFQVSDDPAGIFSGIDVRIDASSVDTRVGARDEDLRSARFFEVATFPAITYQATDSAPSDGLWTVAGELTIRDVTRPVTLEVTLRGATLDQHGNTRLGLSATTKLARSDFKLTTELLQESGETGALDIDVRIDVEAILQPTASATT